jgi:hypothetical protein
MRLWSEATCILRMECQSGDGMACSSAGGGGKTSTTGAGQHSISSESSRSKLGRYERMRRAVR